jgi:predicted DNA-binding transcriptional regulator AlpA
MTGYEVVSFKGLWELGIKYSRSQIDRLEKEYKTFPASFKLHASPKGRRVWWLKDVIAWLKSKT